MALDISQHLLGGPGRPRLAMCGLAGMFDPRGRSSTGELAVLAESMAATLRHRGPDAGVWVGDQGLVAFGHRRLSVIDLSAAGLVWGRSSGGC
jgi:asparagine synthetase B (glutamine-hydrolysing)